MNTGLIVGIIIYILYAVLIIYLVNNYLSTYISKDKLPRIGYYLLLANLLLICMIYVFRNLITINIDRIIYGTLIIMNSIISYLAINKDKNTWNAIKAHIIISSILLIGRLVYIEQNENQNIKSNILEEIKIERFLAEFNSSLQEQVKKNNNVINNEQFINKIISILLEQLKKNKIIK
jgi:hypothetical protein